LFAFVFIQTVGSSQPGPIANQIEVMEISYSKDENRVYTVCAQEQTGNWDLKVLDFETWETIKTYSENNLDYAIVTLNFSPDTRFLAQGTISGEVVLHNIKNQKEFCVLDAFTKNSWTLTSEFPFFEQVQGLADWADNLAFSPSAQLLLSGSYDETEAKLWDIASGRLLRIYDGQKNGVSGLAISKDENYVAIANKNKNVYIY